MLKIEKEAVLITPKDFKPSGRNFNVIGAFNPGVLRLRNGNILLYVRVSEKLNSWRDDNYIYSPRFVSNTQFKLNLDKFKKELVSRFDKGGFHFKNGTLRLKYISHLRRVWLSKDGFSIKKIEQKPCFYGTPLDGELGVEDPRITKMGDHYIMTYVSLSRFNSISSSYALSEDGLRWHKRGIIFRHQNKDVVIFPKKIKNRYVAFNRPEGNFEFSLPHMWISYSKDLEYWGDDKTVLLSKRGWDSIRVGAGTVPLKTKKGWLAFYHGIRKFNKHKRQYCVGVALFDLNNPSKLIAKSSEPIIVPTLKEERTGLHHDVVFPTGALLNKNKILLYSGGADSVVIVREIDLEEVFNHLKKC